MSCCGKKRMQWMTENPKAERTAGPPSPVDESGTALVSEEDSPAHAQGPVWFEYIGRFPRAVTGAFTGQVYHFAVPGTTLAVARPDAPGLRAEIDLRVVPAPTR